MKYAKTINEFKKLGGIIQFEGLNSVHLLGKTRKYLTKGYLGQLYYIFIDEELVEVSYLTYDEFERPIKKYLFKKCQ